MRKHNILREKSFDFAIKIIRLYKELVETKKEYVLSKQILKSGTSIGALIRESENATGKKDLIYKLTIALKEADETFYWLDLLFQTGFIQDKEYLILSKQVNELISMLIASVKTLKTNLSINN